MNMSRRSQTYFFWSAEISGLTLSLRRSKNTGKFSMKSEYLVTMFATGYHASKNSLERSLIEFVKFWLNIAFNFLQLSHFNLLAPPHTSDRRLTQNNYRSNRFQCKLFAASLAGDRQVPSYVRSFVHSDAGKWMKWTDERSVETRPPHFPYGMLLQQRMPQCHSATEPWCHSLKLVNSLLDDFLPYFLLAGNRMSINSQYGWLGMYVCMYVYIVIVYK